MARSYLHTALSQSLSIVVISGALAVTVNLARHTRVPWDDRPAFEQMPIVITAEAYNDLAEGDCLFLDARPVEFYRRGHILNAISLPLKSTDAAVRNALPQPLPYRRIIVYCEDDECHAADAMARRLKRLGYTELYVMEGGWQLWSHANLPTD